MPAKSKKLEQPASMKVEVKDVTLAQLLDLLIHDVKTIDARLMETERKSNVIVESLQRIEHDVHEFIEEIEHSDDEDVPEGIYS